MHKKFVIQNKSTEKFVSLDWEGCDIVYVKSFLDAYSFKISKHASDFIIEKRLKIEDFELFQLEVIAKPKLWD